MSAPPPIELTESELWEELQRQLGGRAPVYWHEPLLSPGRLAWCTEQLPVVLVASDLWADLEQSFGASRGQA